MGAIDVDFYLGGDPNIHILPQQLEAIHNLRDWVAAHPGQSWRVYNTAAGLRMIRTDAPQPLDQSYVDVVNAIDGADKLYSRLCKEQNAFRLRISAQPQRIDCEYPGWSPYCWDQDEGFYDGQPTSDDLSRYEMAAMKYKVCELVEVIGTREVHKALVFALSYHDDSCRVNSPDATPERPHASEQYAELRNYWPNTPAMIAYDDVYRPNGMAPDSLWESMPGGMKEVLRSLGGAAETEDYRRIDRLAEKWCPERDFKKYDELYAEAHAIYAEDAQKYHWDDVEKVWGHYTEEEIAFYPYWRVTRDADGTGSAIIRFLPSAKTDDKYDVLNRDWYIVVLRDPKCPENDGKVFKLKYINCIAGKIQDQLSPPPEFPEMVPVNVFNLRTGSDFKLRVIQLEGQSYYAKSTFENPGPVGDDAMIADIEAQLQRLVAANRVGNK
jgi:hypothetical protein